MLTMSQLYSQRNGLNRSLSIHFITDPVDFLRIFSGAIIMSMRIDLIDVFL